MFELEGRGLPVAYVDTPGRLPRIRRREGIFEIEYAAARRLAGADDRAPRRRAALEKIFEEFGFHRALRLAGARPGDRVRVGGIEARLWAYPEPTLKATNDGIRGYRYVETPPSARLSRAELEERARSLAPRVIAALTAPGKAT